MALNLAGISQATTAATSLAGLVLVTPQTVKGYQPQNFPSWKNDKSAPPKALLFHYEGEQSVELKSDITDHYIEDNTAIHDQIALKPVIIKTAGFIGELNNVPPAELEAVRTASEKLTTIGSFTPQLSATALLAYQKALFLYQVGRNVANSAVQAWSTINGGANQTVINGSSVQQANKSTQTIQQQYFQQFFGYYAERKLFTVQTPWAVFQDCAIDTFRSVQDPETNVISTFEVTFKQLRFAKTISLERQVKHTNSDAFSSRLENQGAPVTDLGTQNLEAAPESFSGQNFVAGLA